MSPTHLEARRPEAETEHVKGRVVKSRLSHFFWTFIVVAGPGLIVMEADNDAGAVLTYTQAGAQYGTHLLWLLLLLLPVTYFAQEMVVRLGIVTGQGHAAMIYQRFGRGWGAFSLIDLQLVNFLTLVTEFAAIDLSLSKLGVDPRLGVPIAAVALIAIVMTASYRRWERIVVFLCLLDTTWLVLAAMVKPDLHDVAVNTFIPSLPGGRLTADLVFLSIGVVGTTIAPWQLFFQQSCVADKRLRFADLFHARLDTFLSACFTIIVAACMMLVGNAGRQHGFKFTDPAQLAIDLGTVYGPFLKTAVLLFFINASVLGTTAISLASAWAQGEVSGFEHSLEDAWNTAPWFYAVYALCVGLAAAIVLIPNAPLAIIILAVQVLAGIMLPSAIIFLNLLLNDKDVLGEQYVNRPWNNWINWTIIILLFVLSGVLAAQVMLPGLFPGSNGGG